MSVMAGDVPGVKAAAVRKLAHELGIAPAQVPLEHFKFLTRCAARLTSLRPQESVKGLGHSSSHIACGAGCTTAQRTRTRMGRTRSGVSMRWTTSCSCKPPWSCSRIPRR